MKTVKYKGKKIKIPKSVYLKIDKKRDNREVSLNFKPLTNTPVSGEGPGPILGHEIPLSLSSWKPTWKPKPLHFFKEDYSLIMRHLNEKRELVVLNLLRKVFSEKMIRKIIKDPKKYLDLINKMGLKIIFITSPLPDEENIVQIIIGSYSKGYVKGEGEIIHEIKGWFLKI